ncbi:hypothetical protein CTAYLR_006735 [Chrysophaeum taylorii]|uniref:Uncharacterized protein n=1 Tax=Chrysophaeum taylorii TaxID=2483200 RepID=A0AAD7UBH2_9STRA|nr:hypothetical protein CTAYLR_006735 [Chrysophaeum taylorii]
MRRRRQIPPDIAENPELAAAIASALPTNYRFGVKKTLWRLRESGARRVALQLPEGLLISIRARPSSSPT